MTEDDTFRILKRIPLRDLCIEICDNPSMLSAGLTPFLIKRGWTYDEFCTSLNLIKIKDSLGEDI